MIFEGIVVVAGAVAGAVAAVSGFGIGKAPVLSLLLGVLLLFAGLSGLFGFS